MIKSQMHPNTRVLLEAWSRITNESSDAHEEAPRTRDYPDLISGLFVVDQIRNETWIFRSAGPQLERAMNRELIDHDFCSLWDEADRSMIDVFLNSVHHAARPGILSARGATLTGESIELEITMAPLVSARAERRPARLLGLYQHLKPLEVLRARPVWRHELVAAFPPRTPDVAPALRLVSATH